MRIDSGCVDEPTKLVFEDNQRLLAYSTILKGKARELFTDDAREGYHKKGEACVVNMQSLRSVIEGTPAWHSEEWLCEPPIHITCPVMNRVFWCGRSNQ